MDVGNMENRQIENFPVFAFEEHAGAHGAGEMDHKGGLVGTGK